MTDKIKFYTLPNGKTIRLRHLFPAELDLLLKVPATIYQAKKIIKRNAGLMRAIVENREERTSIGCPHCKWSFSKNFSCGNCAWNILIKDLKTDSFYPCCEMTFGGFTIHDTIIIYAANYESINDLIGLSGIDCLVVEKTFLLAHIEWAKAVIAMGGIPWPNGKLTATRQKVRKTS